MRLFKAYSHNGVPHGATDFLKKDHKLAALLPAVARMADLQRDCAACLPTMFGHCAILSFEQGVLLLSTPSAALAAKLKQQLPKLQDALLKKGWQVNAVRLRVQMTKAAEIKEQMRSLSLPPAAVDAFDQLSTTLEPSKQNAELIQALQRMVQRRRERPDY